MTEAWNPDVQQLESTTIVDRVHRPIEEQFAVGVARDASIWDCSKIVSAKDQITQSDNKSASTVTLRCNADLSSRNKAHWEAFQHPTE